MKNLNGLLAVLAIFLYATASYGQANYVKRINCGKTTVGDIQYLGETFNPDRPVDEGFEYTGDSNATNGHTNFTLGDVFKPTRYTQDQFMKYEFPVTESGDYRAILHFAEVYHGPGLSGNPSNYRRFNVEIENTQQPEDINLAVFEAAGNVVNGIYTINRVVNVTDGKVTIILSEGAGNDPIISAIEVLGEFNTSGGGSGGYWTQAQSGNDIYFNSGNVGIGTTAIANYKLAVDGNLRSREVRVDGDNWADYVFLNDYKLPSLEEVEQHILENGHLMNIPSAEEVETNGIALGEMNKLLLEKIEELTLYVIEIKKEVNKLKNNQ